MEIMEEFKPIVNPLTGEKKPNPKVEEMAERISKECVYEPVKEAIEKAMEEKELDLVELLKNHIGEEFYSPCFGYVILEVIHTPEVNDTRRYLLVRPKESCVGREIVYSNGKYRKGGQVILYPSLALYEKYSLDPEKSWEEWEQQEELKKYTLRVSVGMYLGPDVKNHNLIESPITKRNYYKLLEEIKEVINKYKK